MLFKEELAQKIILGEKTQTRRPVGEGEKLLTIDGKKTVLTSNGRIKWQVERDYAVQYGRGKPCRWYHPERSELLSYDTYLDICSIANPQLSLDKMDFNPLRITILDIWKEDVRNISHEDSVAEGFSWQNGFWSVWTTLYNKTATEKLQTFDNVEDAYDFLCWHDSEYQAWAIKFTLWSK